MSTVARVRREQGFDVFTLRSESIEVEVAPELGAKVISIKNRRTAREWLYRPPGDLRLFRNRLGDDFAASTLVGWDECLPTVASCTWNGRTLPDHGEAWRVAWQVDEAAWQRSVLSTTVRLGVTGLLFARTIELSDREVQVRYTLTNPGNQAEAFLWAMHPLLAMVAGDRLDLPADVRSQLAGESWIDSLTFGEGQPACAKVFAGPVRDGRAGVANPRTGDRLSFHWDAAENTWLGLWLTRGGWHGHHHLALEPTNGMPDSLAVAADHNLAGQLPPHGCKSWAVRLCVDP